MLLWLACVPDGSEETGVVVSDSPPETQETADTQDSPPDTDETAHTGDSDCVEVTWYLDGDADGWGDADQTTDACEVPPDYVAQPGDCDDQDDQVNPDAAEVCNNGVDDDCSGDDNGCTLSGTYATANATWVFTGSAGAAAGISMEAVGDIDGDGVDDLAVGGQDWTSTRNEGRAWFVAGDANLASRPLDVHPYWTGPDADDALGFQVGAADLDDDGHPELAVSLVNGDAGSNGGGEVYLFQGGSTPQDPHAVLIAGATAKWLGASLRTADIDGDGVDELLVGAPVDAGRDGAIYLLDGLPSGTVDSDDYAVIEGPSGDRGYVGHRRASDAGDADGDGLPELVAGAYGADDADGEVHLLAGDTDWTDGASLDTPWYDAASGSQGYLGWTVRLQDLDDDGYDDVLTGAYRHDGPAGETSGAAWVFAGGAVMPDAVDATDARLTIDASDAGSQIGHELVVAGDLDHDGTHDLVTTLPAWNTQGAVVVFYAAGASWTGTLTDADADVRVEGTTGDYLGSRAVLVDLNADGVQDLFVSARHAQSGDGVVYGFAGGTL